MCRAPARRPRPHWCDVHHLLHWAHGGETEPGNLALLCERHHAKVHHGFRVERDTDGRWRTWRPDGTEILLLPHLTRRTADARAG
ncbi:HNH endonuclease signature motif containing protein [Blastococcus saxobsidens]|uniref:HNH endonuclease signature motif containing protein n=1 Tax=Blastococcus saxobsidens TaxID=138336 RepID=UPI001F5E3927|nr:HNH endonuclease signature motif containing protein [Blastococcus saxobsidens]